MSFSNTLKINKMGFDRTASGGKLFPDNPNNRTAVQKIETT